MVALVGTVRDSSSLAESVIIQKFMRGVFNTRPALPRNHCTWDVSIVLRFLERLSNKSSSLLWLSRKLSTLISLLTGHRGQSIHLLDLQDIECSDSSLVIRFGTTLKQTRPGQHAQEVVVPAFKTPGLCVVATYRSYLSKTQAKRSKGTTRLFISSIKPHKAVSRDTVSNWIRATLVASGVDMRVFSSHSTRAASTSAALDAKVPLATILTTAGWSTDSTFRKHYNLPIRRDTSFAKAILHTVG